MKKKWDNVEGNTSVGESHNESDYGAEKGAPSTQDMSNPVERGAKSTERDADSSQAEGDLDILSRPGASESDSEKPL